MRAEEQQVDGYEGDDDSCKAKAKHVTHIVTGDALPRTAPGQDRGSILRRPGLRVGLAGSIHRRSPAGLATRSDQLNHDSRAARTTSPRLRGEAAAEGGG